MVTAVTGRADEPVKKLKNGDRLGEVFRMPVCRFTEATFRKAGSLTKMAEDTIMASEFPHCRAVKFIVPQLCGKFFWKIRTAELTTKPYRAEAQRVYEYLCSSRSGWVFLRSEAEKYQTVQARKLQELPICARLAAHMREFVGKKRELERVQCPSQYERFAFNKVYSYNESMKADGPVFDNICVFVGQDGKDEPEGVPVFDPSELFFNDAMACGSWELFSQTVGSGDGLSEQWLYFKTFGTGTIGHEEGFGWGSINVFGGLGFVSWMTVGSDQRDKLHRLYAEMEDATRGRKQSVHRLDFLTKHSGPTSEQILAYGIDLYHAEQRDGEVILTLPQCWHSVFNMGVGFATARNFICPQSVTVLDDEVRMVRSSVPVKEEKATAHQLFLMEAFSEMIQTNHQDRYTEHYTSAMDKLELKSVRAKAKYHYWNVLDPAQVIPNGKLDCVDRARRLTVEASIQVEPSMQETAVQCDQSEVDNGQE